LFGLQRALSVAGARTTLLSLWKVDDKATAAFMEAYYTRLKGRAGRADALAATQAEFRSHQNTAWRHPYYWAAWQLVGDWRPITGL
jgi:CHAT domain-containing protein